jgi:hypothetical protein
MYTPEAKFDKSYSTGFFCQFSVVLCVKSGCPKTLNIVITTSSSLGSLKVTFIDVCTGLGLITIA